MAAGVAREFGEDYQVRTQEVTKNNGVKMLGIMVTQKNRNISPTIYLEGFYEQYLQGKDLEHVMEEIIGALRKGMPASDIDLSFFSDFEEVKKKICYKLVNAQKNEDTLRNMPFIPYLDLAICFYYPIRDEGIGRGSILIQNSHMEMWKVSVKDLWKAAEKNTKMLNPAECFTMERMMLELVGLLECDEPVGELPSERGIPMYVLTNHERSFGAAVILYKGYLERIAECIGGNYYLLPSSIHEMILIPKMEDLEEEDEDEHLKWMVEEVNQTAVEAQDLLSDSIYYYDQEQKRLSVKMAIPV